LAFAFFPFVQQDSQVFVGSAKVFCGQQVFFLPTIPEITLSDSATPGFDPTAEAGHSLN
jgi:hypothetical protein